MCIRDRVEATAFGSRRIVEHMKGQGLRIDSVNAIGGISKKAPFVMQTLADVPVSYTHLLFAGLSVLETSTNSYVLAIGPESTATRRLNLSQAFNSCPWMAASSSAGSWARSVAVIPFSCERMKI